MHLDTERRFAERVVARGLADTKTIERLRDGRGPVERGERARSLARLLCDAKLLERDVARSLLGDSRRERAAGTAAPLGLESSRPEANPPLGIRYGASSSASPPAHRPGSRALRRGDRLGPYEVQDELGRGG